uniref:Small ribosomal subunit protein eS1 n=1 Tax=Lepeophtheirus salmonis TaxID=72036 RepID=D3PJI0_LEPSM|nr:40S ribosomal protein S3a [Lepeophtheirus salmonis]
MAIGGGKNVKGGKKGKGKKVVDPFTKKEWYEIKAPSMFEKSTCARTLVTRTQGTKIASEGLKKRVVRLSLGDLKNESSEPFRKFGLQIESVQGKHCYTNFHSMEITRDKLCSMIKKKQSTIEIRVDAKTTDGYKLRIFIIAFTIKPKEGHMYAKTSGIKRMRKKIIERVSAEVSSCDLPGIVKKLIPDSIGEDAKKAGSQFYHLGTAMVRKVKILRRPKLDVTKLMNMYGETTTADGETVIQDHYEPQIVDSV